MLKRMKKGKQLVGFLFLLFRMGDEENGKVVIGYLVWVALFLTVSGVLLEKKDRKKEGEREIKRWKEKKKGQTEEDKLRFFLFSLKTQKHTPPSD